MVDDHAHERPPGGTSPTCLQSAVTGAEDEKPAFAITDPARLPDKAPEALRKGLNGLGATQRLKNPWLWDAITTAILRQVVRADQARKLYRKWCASYGTTVQGPHGELAVAPTPDQVLELTDDQFAAIGVKFHRGALQAAATHYQRHALHWPALGRRAATGYSA